MNKKYLVGFLLFLPLLITNTAFSQSSKTDANIIALQGATVIDGTGAEPTENVTVLIQGNEIICVGECDTPENATVKDVSGKYIMPGLVDLHVHYGLTGWVDSIPGILGTDVSDRYPYEEAYDKLENGSKTIQRSQLCSGVTTAFEPGGFPWGYTVQQNTTNSSNAPRYLTAGPILTSLPTVINHPLAESMSIYLEDEETARNAVRMLYHRGNKWVKVHRPDLFNDRNRRSMLLDAISEEASKAGMSLIANTTTLESAKDVLRAGATLFVYPVEDTLIDQEFIDLAKKNNLVYTPAFEAGTGRKEIKARKFDENRLPLNCVDPQTRMKAFYTDSLASGTDNGPGIIPQQAQEIRQIREENFRRIHDAGITIAVGSSSGAPLTFHGPATANEIKAMTKAGLSPMEAIVAATKNGADALGLDDVGTIQEGKRADLLILNANPLEDITNIREMEFVIKEGKVWQRDLLEYE